MFISHSLAEHVKGCGILPFDSMFTSDHIPLYVAFNVAILFGHPTIGTEKEVLRDLQLDNPCLIDAYEATMCQQLKNDNVENRVTLLYDNKSSEWGNSEEKRFNKIDRDIERAMICAINRG
jgi:hypothetical protein